MDYRPKGKSKIVKQLEENIGENFCDLGLGKYFLGRIPKSTIH